MLAQPVLPALVAAPETRSRDATARGAEAFAQRLDLAEPPNAEQAAR
jgi:hypothetical protein